MPGMQTLSQTVAEDGPLTIYAGDEDTALTYLESGLFDGVDVSTYTRKGFLSPGVCIVAKRNPQAGATYGYPIRPLALLIGFDKHHTPQEAHLDSWTRYSESASLAPNP